MVVFNSILSKENANKERKGENIAKEQFIETTVYSNSIRTKIFRR